MTAERYIRPVCKNWDCDGSGYIVMGLDNVHRCESCNSSEEEQKRIEFYRNQRQGK